MPSHFIRPSNFFFPTCQVRVVRFYQSCSPTRLAVLLLLLLVLVLLLLLLQFLLEYVCINFHLHFRLANSSPSSLPTSQLSVHRWTSTWDLPSSVRTAGPQPRTFPAQCAPLDLNLGPSELSSRRWTSTWLSQPPWRGEPQLRSPWGWSWLTPRRGGAWCLEVEVNLS